MRVYRDAARSRDAALSGRAAAKARIRCPRAPAPREESRRLNPDAISAASSALAAIKAETYAPRWRLKSAPKYACLSARLSAPSRDEARSELAPRLTHRRHKRRSISLSMTNGSSHMSVRVLNATKRRSSMPKPRETIRGIFVRLFSHHAFRFRHNHDVLAMHSPPILSLDTHQSGAIGELIPRWYGLRSKNDGARLSR